MYWYASSLLSHLPGQVSATYSLLELRVLVLAFGGATTSEPPFLELLLIGTSPRLRVSDVSSLLACM